MIDARAPAPASSIRWLIVIPGLLGAFEPVLGGDGHPIELLAPDRRTALRLATARGLAPAASVVSRLEFEELQRRSVDTRSARRRRNRHPAAGR